MGIQEVTLENFTVFERLQLELSAGVNIFIGENGTGKTHLLKAIYALCELHRYDDIINIGRYFVNGLEKGQFFVRQLKPMFAQIEIPGMKNKEDKQYLMGKLHFDLTVNGHQSVIEAGSDEEASYRFSYPEKPVGAIFIPAKDMLSHSKGFLALNNKFQMPFDQTYIDIISNAELPEANELQSFQKAVLDILSKQIDGTVVYENDTFYVCKTNGLKVEFSLEAEGFRKLGLLWKLIKNGLIEKDSILLWDEPEANINPSLIPVLVDILLELQRNGVQIFLATHNYIFAKYFEVKRQSQDQVMFYSLYKDEASGVRAEKNVNFRDIKNNPIIQAYDKLLNEVIDRNLGD